MTLRAMIVGPFPRSVSRIDGGVAAATMYLSQAMASSPDVELIGVRISGGSATASPADDLGWPVFDIGLGRFSVSTFFRRQQREFDSVVRRLRPDIIHAQGADAAGYLAVRSERPAVVTVHGMLAECAKYRTNPVRRLRERLQARITEQLVVGRARHVIAISPYVAKYYSDRLRGTVYDIPNPVAQSYFELSRRPEPRRFLFAGRISMGKGLLDLVHAVALRPEAVERVVLAGAAPERDFQLRLAGEIETSRVGHLFDTRGLLNEQALLAEFQSATALVLPSYQETAPMVIQQAMASGLPVIATRVGGIPDLIEHEVSGLLFEAGDIAGLGRLMKRVVDDPALCARLAASARVRAVQTCTAERVAAVTLDVYRRVLASD
jgi:glycosyltransferase involved in cell wall biosynthesis